MKSRLTLVLVAASLVGCATPPPTQQEIASADYGPFPDQYQLKIANYLRATLKDPDSVKLSAPTVPRRTYAGLNKPQYGWGTCIGVNGKNSFGGYTGTKLYFFLFRNGELEIAEREDDRMISYDSDYAHRMCKRLM